MTSWLNHSRSTSASPTIRSKCGRRDSMSISVSFTSKTRTAGWSLTAVSALLKNPGVAVWIAEVGEARVIGSVGVGAEAETPLPPSAVEVFVPDGAHADTVVDEFVARCADVLDDEVQALY